MRIVNWLLLACIIYAPYASACSCNYKKPEILINGEPHINATSGRNLLSHFPSIAIPQQSKHSTSGVHLKELIPPGLDNARIVVFSCKEKLFSASLKQLSEITSPESQYYLSLDKRGVLKLVHADSPDQRGKTLLKRISMLEVVSNNNQPSIGD